MFGDERSMLGGKSHRDHHREEPGQTLSPAAARLTPTPRRGAVSDDAD